MITNYFTLFLVGHRLWEYEDKTDIIEVAEFITKNIPVVGNKKLKFTEKRVRRLLKHPHKAIRWLTVIHADKKFMPIIEKHYYKESKNVVREQIIRRSHDIGLLNYALLNEADEKLKQMAMKKYSHLVTKEEK